ncbi:MAG: hypothetical protein JWR61_5273 [Ferruginibacter sp.]|uniref:hypothetical protein n=1 Tax=Ferruginibacter sp. TaxID=1940288 RepID=UPI00265990ED|nr:hypothetical protein [Ferruginibacter sp.]MDB5280318.1 hypothetical protein [Ferruginibacter sp.]
MSDTLTVDLTIIQQWIAAKLEPEIVEQKLKESGLDAASISTHLRAFRKLKNAKKLQAGFICMAAGAFLGFVSCLLTILNPFPDLYNVILFGLTSVAICIICLGMYLVFE